MNLAHRAILVSLLSVSGCAATPPPDILPAVSPVDPTLGIRPTHHHPVIVDYHPRQPVDPQNWRKLNDDLSPAKTGAGT
ncbi:hypothetical protein [Mesorhizobium sp. 10J20-29]|jgi:hypothetical protein|nr:hypothetical protein [Alphaproteobacteria bacterium]